MARHKTKAEKIKSAYRLDNFKLVGSERAVQKDQAEFAYLDASLVKKDLLKTAIISAVMIGLIWIAKQYLG